MPSTPHVPDEGAQHRVGVILAAGAARRMGCPKLALPWPPDERWLATGGLAASLESRPRSTVIGHVFDAIAPWCRECFIVLGAHAEAVRAALGGRPVREVQGSAEEPMLGSVHRALRAVQADAPWAMSILLTPGDHVGVSDAPIGDLVRVHEQGGRALDGEPNGELAGEPEGKPAGEPAGEPNSGATREPASDRSSEPDRPLERQVHASTPLPVRSAEAGAPKPPATRPAVVPESNGRGGHPVLIPIGLVPRILAWHGPGGLAGFWRANPELVIRVSGAPITALRDLDEPSEYGSRSDFERAEGA